VATRRRPRRRRDQGISTLLTTWITPSGVPLLNTLLVLLAVVVMAAHGVVKLVLLPFQALRGLFQQNAKPAQITAR
jgi:hypothetical protein